jgi:hypothetical protein
MRSANFHLRCKTSFQLSLKKTTNSCAEKRDYILCIVKNLVFVPDSWGEGFKTPGIS